MGETHASADFEKIAAMATELKDYENHSYVKKRKKIIEKCFTSGHVCGKICACEK